MLQTSLAPLVPVELLQFGSTHVFSRGLAKKCLSDSGMDLTGKRREDLQRGSLLTLSKIALL